MRASRLPGVAGRYQPQPSDEVPGRDNECHQSQFTNADIGSELHAEEHVQQSDNDVVEGTERQQGSDDVSQGDTALDASATVPKTIVNPAIKPVETSSSTDCSSRRSPSSAARWKISRGSGATDIT